MMTIADRVVIGLVCLAMLGTFLGALFYLGIKQHDDEKRELDEKMYGKTLPPTKDK